MKAFRSLKVAAAGLVIAGAALIPAVSASAAPAASATPAATGQSLISVCITIPQLNVGTTCIVL